MLYYDAEDQQQQQEHNHEYFDCIKEVTGKVVTIIMLQASRYKRRTEERYFQINDKAATKKTVVINDI